MILNYATSKDSAVDLSMDAWIAKLGEGKKSTQQLQTELLESTTDSIDEMKQKLAERLKEASKEESADGTASTNTDETTVTDDIKDPSEVTAEDLQSPIDIKL
ncbi:MAG: hypothetical protein ACLSUS_03340 [Opitutales bacterium]|jgi:hypothetical protein